MNPIHYDSDPEQFISNKFQLYEGYWNSVLEPECTDNWERFLGFDPYIRRRAAENRSSLQSHLLFPAIEGRTSTIMSKLRSREPLLRYEAEDKSDPFEVLRALKIQEWVRNVLDRQNWLSELSVMIMAAEIWPVAWVKCRVGEMEMRPAELRKMGEMLGVPPQLLAGQRRMVPEFEVLPPSQVFFDYRVKSPHEYVQKFHVKHISLDEAHDRFGSDVVSKIEEHDSSIPQWEREWEQAMGRRTWREQGESRYRLAEGWISAHFEDGRVQRRMVHFFPDVIADGSNNYAGLLVSDDKAPVSFDPFIRIVARRVPGQTMGVSSVGLGKALQREDAELTNMAIDILGYTAAPPILMPPGAVANPQQLQFAARSLWMMEDASIMPQPLHVPTPNAPFMETMRRALNEKMNHTVAAHEGVTGQASPDKGAETLGEYRSRNMGGIGRLDLPYLGYADAVRQIGELYWYYIREFPRMMIGRTPLPVNTKLGAQYLTADDLDVDASVRVPNLTEFENNEMKKIELDRALERLALMPIVAGNLEAQRVLAEIYLRRHIYDPDDLQELYMALRQPLDPALMMPQGGRSLSLPRTNFSPGTGGSERSGGFIPAMSAGGG